MLYLSKYPIRDSSVNFSQDTVESVDNRQIAPLNTGPRRICGIQNKQCKLPDTISHGTIEMDSHADTAVCGSNFVVLDYTS